MNNKGFTLIELIITIALIAAISVTVGLSMSGLLERENQKQVDEYRETIEKAACLYAVTHDVESVSLQTLIDEGLLRKDLENPESKMEITNYRNHAVEINMIDGERKCFYNIDQQS